MAKQDLKIELTTLYSLHCACTQLEHGIRPAHLPKASWEPYAPSRFVYAFFAFNSMYGVDWQTSFASGSICPWVRFAGGKYISELALIERLLAFFYVTLGDETPQFYSSSLQANLLKFAIPDADEQLKHVQKHNENKYMPPLRHKLLVNFETAMNAGVKADSHRLAVIGLLSYIYCVRCNIFHGSKTSIAMQDQSQQWRLLVYTSAVVATSGLLFEIAERSSNWRKPVTKLQAPP